MKHFIFFVIIGVFFGLYYSIWGNEMFDAYNVDYGTNNQKIKNLKNMPISLRVERFWHRFVGVFIGWMLVWILLDMRIDIFSGRPRFDNLGFADLILFMLGYIGINGRLPTIAHSVQDWLKRS